MQKKTHCYAKASKVPFCNQVAYDKELPKGVESMALHIFLLFILASPDTKIILTKNKMPLRHTIRISPQHQKMQHASNQHFKMLVI